MAKKKNLMDEIWKDEWDLFIIPPELLHSPEIDNFFLAQTPGSRSDAAQLDLVFIDECHLVREHGDEFRKVYSRIGLLRSRLDFKIPWVAVTATLPPGKFTDHVLHSLGFEEGNYVMHRMRVDVPNIEYIPCFFQHSISGSTFFDISWLIPVGKSSLDSLKKTVIFCETIKLACSVVAKVCSLKIGTIVTRSSCHSILCYQMNTVMFISPHIEEEQHGYLLGRTLSLVAWTSRTLSKSLY